MYVDFGLNLKDNFEHDDENTMFKFNTFRSLTIHLIHFSANQPNIDRRDIMSIIQRCPHIYKLFFDLPVVWLPNLCQFSTDLIKIRLKRTWFEDDPMPTLEKLPKLKIRCLNKDAFKGKEMVCFQGGFLQLESHTSWTVLSKGVGGWRKGLWLIFIVCTTIIAFNYKHF